MVNMQQAQGKQSSDVGNYAIDYGEHAASTRKTTSITTPAVQQAWRIPTDQASDVLSLC
jgi:hypothetical protein